MGGRSNIPFPVPNYHHLHLCGPSICLGGRQLVAGVGSDTSAAHVGKPISRHSSRSSASNGPSSSPDP